MTPLETVESVKTEVTNDSISVEAKLKAIHRIIDRYREHRKERHFEIAIGLSLVIIAFLIANVFHDGTQNGPLTGATILLVCAGITYLLSQFSGSIEVKSQTVKATGIVGIFVFCCLLMTYFSNGSHQVAYHANNDSPAIVRIPMFVSSAYADDDVPSEPLIEGAATLPESSEHVEDVADLLEYKVVYPVGAGLKKATGINLASSIKALSSTGNVKVFSEGARIYALGNYFRDSKKQELVVTYNPRAATKQKISEIVESMEYDFVESFSFEEGKPGDTDILIEVRNSSGNQQ